MLAGAGEKMSKAEINECLATINRFDLVSTAPFHSPFQHSFLQGNSERGPTASGAQRRIF